MKDEAVTLWVNSVGPYHNPQVIYLFHLDLII